MAYTEQDLLKMTVEITIAAVGASGEKSGLFIVNNPENTADYLQVVYDKLRSINDGFSS